MSRALLCCNYLFSTVVQAQFNYSISLDFTVTITGYTGPGGAVVIPTTIQGLPVTVIGPGAFQFSTTLTSITVADTVTNIGDYAFNGCSSLANVTIGKGVTSIGYQAFDYCANLTQLSIPDNVVNLGGWAFSNSGLLNLTIGNGVTNLGIAFIWCTRLESITIGRGAITILPGAFTACGSLLDINVDTNNPYYSSIDGVLFDKNQSTLIVYPAKKPGTYTIPGTVTAIASQGFYDCAGLTSISIPSSVTYISDFAFAGCTALLNLAVPDSVTYIGNEAFQSGTSLTNLSIGKSVGTIGQDAFSDCRALTDINIPDNVTNLGVNAFARCTSLANVTLPRDLTFLGEQAFAYCTNLTSVNIPSGIIRNNAFLNCSSLGTVTIGPNVTYIYEDVFLNCFNLTGIYFQGNAPSLYPGAVLGADRSIVYYAPGTTGWGSTFAGRPALPINLQIQVADASFGIRTNQFGFNITGSYGLNFVVEAATNHAVRSGTRCRLTLLAARCRTSVILHGRIIHAASIGFACL